jgi:hypothetical protein
MKARNLQAVEQSRRERDEIRGVMLDLAQRWPLARHTEKSIARHLSFALPRSTLHWHIQQIRAEADAESATATAGLEIIQSNT